MKFCWINQDPRAGKIKIRSQLCDGLEALKSSKAFLGNRALHGLSPLLRSIWIKDPALSSG
jgi:hypothetical protein